MPRRKKKDAETEVESSLKPIILRQFTEAEIMAENQRKKIMLVGISFVMLLVFIAWVANLKKIVSVNAMNVGSLIEIEEFKNNFSENLKVLSSDVTTITDEIATTTPIEKKSSEIATSSEAYNTNVEEINRRLDQILSNASSTINNK